jgi:hypothetical protein
MALLNDISDKLDNNDKWIVKQSQDIKPILAIINKVVWQWYRSNGNDMEKAIFTIKKWGFISFTVRMKHLEDIFNFVFGPPPVTL